MNSGVRIDPEAEAAPYEQIRDQIAALRASGRWPTNFRLPTVRGLADELGLAPNTVARAYRELEASGQIETRGRRGSFIAGSDEARVKAAAQAARDYATLVRELHLEPAHALGIVRAELGLATDE
ncbi:GntR family transcriptional regulator [Nigerium massiliense]|uniref:GntR family transcriptional regulator n=1 Tax=Nigerium massiliense TaxID=1522317 RepID=UPI00058BE8A3|nr:GntR family transcriptional regulator [Nigerium massiliense]